MIHGRMNASPLRGSTEEDGLRDEAHCREADVLGTLDPLRVPRQRVKGIRQRPKEVPLLPAIMSISADGPEEVSARYLRQCLTAAQCNPIEDFLDALAHANVKGMMDLLSEWSNGALGKESAVANDASDVALNSLVTKTCEAACPKQLNGGNVANDPAVKHKLLNTLTFARLCKSTCFGEMVEKSNPDRKDVDVQARWKDVYNQLRGWTYPDEVRPEDSVVENMVRNLDKEGAQRNLPPFNLQKVKSVKEANESQKSIITLVAGLELVNTQALAGDAAAKAATGNLTHKELRAKIRLMFLALSAAGARRIPLARDGGFPGTDGIILIKGGSERRDARVLECQAAERFCLELTEDVSILAANVAVRCFFEHVRAAVSGSSKNTLSLAAAFLAAQALHVHATETLTLAIARGIGRQSNQTKTNPNPKNGKVRKPKRRRGKGGKAGESSEDDFPETPTTKGVLADTRGPNASGDVCGVYVRTGKCKYGDACVHKHPKNRDDPEGSKDVRKGARKAARTGEKDATPDV